MTPELQQRLLDSVANRIGQLTAENIYLQIVVEQLTAQLASLTSSEEDTNAPAED